MDVCVYKIQQPRQCLSTCLPLMSKAAEILSKLNLQRQTI